jgi:hypothetical protein
MDDAYSARPRTGSSRQVRTRAILGTALAAFLLGAGVTWVLAGMPGPSGVDVLSVGSEAPAAERARVVVPPAAAVPAALPPAAAAARQVEAMVQQQGGLDQRVAAMEQRLAQLNLQLQAAGGNAARAEGLLVTFAARRAIERGAELGVLGDQLRLRFGDAQPTAVRTVIRAARDPVTLDQLLARLDGLAPALAEAPPSEGLLGRLKREAGELFVVRREDSPSPAPQRRLQRARLFLESGRADAAVAEVRNLPNAAGAAAWIADATRYAQAQDALETLELAALLEPRQLRDAEGRSVEQLSPVAPR